LLAAIAPFALPRADAYPIQTPHPTPTPSGLASATPVPANLLPYGSTLSFVLESAISSSGSKKGDIVKAHLAQPLVVGGVTLAPAGTDEEIRIVDASPADNPDIYGYVDIYARAMTLPDGRELPLRAPASHLNINVSAGHDSTAAMENTVGDIFTPGILLHIFRKGRNFVLEPGATIKLRTQAALVVSAGIVAIETPAPLLIDAATPNASFRAAPLATVNPSYHPGVPTSLPSIGPSPFNGSPNPRATP
jgi:hypothetical protein